MKVLNLYIEMTDQTYGPSLLKSILIGAGFRIFDATNFDTYTIGPGRLDSVDEIKEEIIRKYEYEHGDIEEDAEE
jgi:hypothetical protein